MVQWAPLLRHYQACKTDVLSCWIDPVYVYWWRVCWSISQSCTRQHKVWLFDGTLRWVRKNWCNGGSETYGFQNKRNKSIFSHDAILFFYNVDTFDYRNTNLTMKQLCSIFLCNISLCHWFPVATLYKNTLHDVVFCPIRLYLLGIREPIGFPAFMWPRSMNLCG